MNLFYDIPSIKLTDQHLTNPILMALAWKRAHSYIRSHNWYADNFELDESTLFLQENCETWIAELSKGVELAPLELVPAPKSSKWSFVEKSDNEDTEDNADTKRESKEIECLVWQPEVGANLSLRPLAHIGIKEQTHLVLLMSCLANTVESMQGDPSTEFAQVHKKGVVNYGNRLFCSYNDAGQAEHNYGGTTIYSKYFVDYRQFLQRPYYFAKQANREKLPSEDVYIIDLDIKQFFDRVSRSSLVSKIKELITEQKPIKNEGEKEGTFLSVNSLLKSFENWQWSEQAKNDYEVCLKEKLVDDEEEDPEPDELANNGIPQGLVAGGFFANIYLLDFDKQMSELLGKSLDEKFLKTFEEQSPLLQGIDFPKAKLVDYCRYVDDIRLVVTVDKNINFNSGLDSDGVKSMFESYLKEHLSESCKSLEFNSRKTKVTLYRGAPKGISTQVQDINQRASGPMGPDDLDELIGQLESLLVFSGTQKPEQTGKKCRINKLAEIEKSTFDLREDTLRRFAANKLARALKEKRHFTSRDSDEKGNPVAGEWDYLQERIARRLIAAWSQDPSLVLLLKKGLELFPSPQLLEPILEQFTIVGEQERQQFSEQCNKQQNAIMEYCLAEIFRHSATAIHKKDLQAIPAHADVAAYFEILQQKAADRVVSKQGKSWCFVVEQARFLLLVRMDTTLEKTTGDAKQDLIFKLAKGFRNIKLKKSQKAEEVSLCILLANQLLDDNTPLLRSALSLITLQLEGERKKILTRIAKQNAELAGQLINSARQIKTPHSWVFDDEIKELAKKLYLDISPSQTPLNKITTAQSLAQLFTRSDNPFANEMMAIKLMLALLTQLQQYGKKHYGKTISLAESRVTFSVGYSEIPLYKHFESELELQLGWQGALSKDLLENEATEHPPLTDDDNALRKIAFVIRAALASSTDTTGFGVSLAPKVGYRGLKSTQVKRKIGLYTTPESLAGEGAQVSGWLTTLLTKLLRWPGIRANDQGYSWPEELGYSTVEKLLKERLENLKASYCQLSNMPALPELVSPAWDEDKKDLNVVMVQSKLPKQADFALDMFLEDPQYRTQHRRHIASVAQLAVSHILVEGIKADVIIWPELAVHPEDLDVLKLLSQKTHAIIFAGLGFQKLPNGKAINSAVWIVPRKHNGNSNEVMRLQGKQHMTELEQSKVQPYRPYQLILELRHPKFRNKQGFMLTGSICYDATDIKLAADLTNKSNTFIISALNKDVTTFDNMVEALHFHMHQPVVLVNTGEFGGSYAMAPYKQHHDKLIAHNTGKNQIAISNFKINMFDFRRDGVGGGMVSKRDIKAKPAGV